ncbi:MAG TPA: benzoate-CoA ligase family protein [Terriglobales bacterium]|jgi:benzoate-CoA ligase|nr:benzoate-CoA ligase family protein [Terriglobales bacterium]
MTQSEFYNAADDLLQRNIDAGRGDKVTIVDDDGGHTHNELVDRVHRCANALREFGLGPGQRILLCLFDSIDFHTSFLGAIKAGVVPVPLNTLWTSSDYAHVLVDSGAAAVIVSEARLPVLLDAAQSVGWNGRVILSASRRQNNHALLTQLLGSAAPRAETFQSHPDDVCFWLYSSGSTGKPKAAVHRQTSMAMTARLFGQGVLSLNENDVTYSAAKLFFAYGLGNSLSFPLYTGATVVLHGGRTLPPVVNAILREKRPTLFCGVPTLYSSLLATADLPKAGEHNLRLCISAGEPLPEHVGQAWQERTGVEIVDAPGSTEMLHCFVSNRPGAVRYGTSGQPVPGYKVKLVDDGGSEVHAGEIGELWVSGPTSCAYYWNHPEKSQSTFVGEWTRTGDKYRQDSLGDLVFCGRGDDMLKVGGIWVSPLEVESVLVSHEAVLEAVVVGSSDENGLVKPRAFVVVKAGILPNDELKQKLKDFVKDKLAPYKYPRWVQFVPELPKTATGKVQRFRLRQLARDDSSERA